MKRRCSCSCGCSEDADDRSEYCESCADEACRTEDDYDADELGLDPEEENDA